MGSTGGMKIGIIGAGPAGLATALCIQKVCPKATVSILEKKEDVALPNVGGGLQVFIIVYLPVMHCG
jgi:protoporphyrinogen oxidase